MKFRNDKTKQELIDNIKKKVFAQDRAVEDLVYFADQVCDRTERLRTSDFDVLDLPQLGSMFIIAPSGTGKTYLATTYARESGMLFHKIDATQITAEGWVGDSFCNHWYAICKMLEKSPDKNVVVLIDEVDKLFAETREGSGKFDLLKVLEGGKYETSIQKSGGQRAQFTLDCDRCIFLLCGAFTGIEDHVKKRLKPSVGFSATEDDNEVMARDFRSKDDYYRSLVETTDLHEWGVPAEIIGRILYITYLNKLDEISLQNIVYSNIEKYKNQYPSIDIRIDYEAVNFIVEKCKNSAYGAREISTMLAKSLIKLSSQEMESEGKNCAVLEVLDENLFLNTFYDESFTAPKCCKPKEVIPYNLASELLCDIEDFVHKSEKTFNPMEELGDNFVEYAANLILHFKESLQYFEDFSLEMANFTEAEVLLLASLHTYLVNYYIDYPEYRKPTYLRQFLATVYPKDYDDIFMSPIEFIFNDWYELGVEDGEIERLPENIESYDNFCKITLYEQAFAYFESFKTYSVEEQKYAIKTLALKLASTDESESDS